MRERKVWSQQEDKILRLLREQRGEKKWANIARIMEQEFSIQGRTGKQCRERYHNHLDSTIVSSEWQPHQQHLLYLLHEEIGNKWSAIAQKIPGRSDNCVKNHFYSKLRKAVRKLNKVIQDHFDSDGYKAIGNGMLSKIIEITESKFKNNSKEDEEFVQLCNEIKNSLFRFDVDVADQMDQDDLAACRRIIEKIGDFDHNFRKTHKPSKKLTGQGQYRIYLKPPKPSIKRQNSTGSNSSYSDDGSSFLSSGSCFSSCSDLSEYDFKSLNSSSTLRGSPNSSAGNIKLEEGEEPKREEGRAEQGREMKAEAQDPNEFIKFHEHLVQESENELMQAEKGHPYEYNNMFYDDTPVMARIFAPSYSNMDEEHSSLFKRKGSDSQQIQFAEQRPQH